MSDIIKLLPDSVANQIAAGEVIQRPASVIKELVENAIDAEATEIQIVLKDAGRTLIQVIDNGKGMSATDARLAFERHSTSKIRKAEDLFSLHTMGFRGEALASIAAISNVELRTTRKEDQVGTKICISGSKYESQEPDVCPVGCNFMIKNLFFNVPARRKFLKSNQVELSNIVKEFEKLALVNYGVEFSLIHNDSVMYKLMGGTFKQRIVALFGHTFETQLIPIKIETSLINIDGFIGRPENSRKRNYQQFFFVNGRYMRHPYFHKAVMLSYGELIPDDAQPNYFLNFSVNPECIDVNIHPTKTEIKFENEAPIWQIISAAVKEALGKFSAVPSIDFDTEGAPEIPAYTTSKDFSKPNIDLDPNYNPFKSTSSPKQSPYRNDPAPSATRNWESLYENFESSKINQNENYQEDSFGFDDSALNGGADSNVELESRLNLDTENENNNSVKNVFQIKNKYLVVANGDDLLVIDQYRAHLKVLYDNYMLQVNEHKPISQKVLFPQVLQLTAGQSELLQSIGEEMEQIGFNLSHLGGTDWAIDGVPFGLEDCEVDKLIYQALENYEEGNKNSLNSIEQVALSTARSGAITAGRLLTVDEMNKLISDLFKLDNPNYTPDGKKVMVKIESDKIEKMF